MENLHAIYLLSRLKRDLMHCAAVLRAQLRLFCHYSAASASFCLSVFFLSAHLASACSVVLPPWASCTVHACHLFPGLSACTADPAASS